MGYEVKGLNYKVIKRKLRDYFSKHNELMQLWILKHINNEILIEYNIDNDIMTDFYNEEPERDDYYHDRD